jgi:hypothetical protein
MVDTIRLVIAWTCVGVFVATAIITVFALVGVIRLPDPKYLNRLFTIIIVAVVGTCASFFKNFISSGADPIAIQSGTNRASPVVPPSTTNRSGQVIPPVPINTTNPVPPKPFPEKDWVAFKHSGGYVAKFYVNWKSNSQPQSWSSGNKTVGYSDVIWLNGNVSEVKITAQAATGLAWDAWATIINLQFDQPPNKTYVVQGTTLNRQWTTEDHMP